MGNNTLPLAKRVIKSANHNALVEALIGNLVPRNGSNEASPLSGQLGNSLYRYSKAYLQEIVLSENCKIYEDAGDIVIEKNGANGSFLKLTNTSFEYWYDSVKIFEISETDLILPSINFSSLKPKWYYIEALESATQTSDLQTFKAGTQILFELGGNIYEGGQQDVSSWSFKVNGGIVGTLPGGGLEVLRRFLYVIPSDGDYQFSVTLNVGTYPNVSARATGTLIIREI